MEFELSIKFYRNGERKPAGRFSFSYTKGEENLGELRAKLKEKLRCHNLNLSWTGMKGAQNE